MSDRFVVCNGYQAEQIKSDLDAVAQSMNTAYQKANALNGKLQSGAWTGKAEQSFQAFMDLMMQYNRALCVNGDNPVSQGQEALNEWMKNLSSFYDNCQIYKELKEFE